MSILHWAKFGSLVSLVLLPVSIEGQLEVVGETAGEPVVLGRVFGGQSADPVANADIILRDASEEIIASALSDGTGLFRLTPAAAGSFQLTVRQLGFSTVVGPLDFTGQGSLIVKVSLPVDPVELPGVEAEARRRPRRQEMNIEGFEARRRVGGGHFFAEEDVVKLRPTRVTDLLARVPGVEIVRLGGAVRDVRMVSSPGVNFRGQRVSRPCFASIWLDGILIREGGYQEGADVGDAHKVFFLNDAIPTEQIGGLEIYTHASRIPPQFRDSSSMCGVIAVWSRRGLKNNDALAGYHLWSYTGVFLDPLATLL